MFCRDVLSMSWSSNVLSFLKHYIFFKQIKDSCEALGQKQRVSIENDVDDYGSVGRAGCPMTRVLVVRILFSLSVVESFEQDTQPLTAHNGVSSTLQGRSHHWCINVCVNGRLRGCCRVLWVCHDSGKPKMVHKKYYISAVHLQYHLE